MTAKKYLQQLKVLSIKIRQREEQIKELKAIAMGSGSLACDGERVQTSIVGDKLSENVAKYIDLQADVKRMIKSYTQEQNVIISQIQSMEDPRYIEILYKRYVELKKFELIAVEMNYDYNWVKNLHGMALMSFERTYSNILSDKL